MVICHQIAEDMLLYPPHSFHLTLEEHFSDFEPVTKANDGLLVMGLNIMKLNPDTMEVLLAENVLDYGLHFSLFWTDLHPPPPPPPAHPKFGNTPENLLLVNRLVNTAYRKSVDFSKIHTMTISILY